MLLTPKVSVAPWAESEMNSYSGFSWTVSIDRPAASMAAR